MKKEGEGICRECAETGLSEEIGEMTNQLYNLYPPPVSERA